MAEIKSSIEIAMEKTKHLIMSKEEKKEQEKRELENKVKALLRRLKERYVDKDDVIKEFRSLTDEDHKRTFIDVLFEEIDLSKEDQEIIVLLQELLGVEKVRIEKEFENLRRMFSEELEKREMIVRERIREHLKEIGIEGDAISINLPSWKAYEEVKEEVRGIFRRRLMEVKERICEGISYR